MCDKHFYYYIHSSLDRSETLQRKGSNHLQQLPVFWRDSGNLQSIRQQRRNLIWSSSVSGGRISPWCRLLSSIWNMKPNSSTAAPLGLNIHMFCEMLERVQVRNLQRPSGGLWRYSRLIHAALLLGMQSHQWEEKEASFYLENEV